jgi:enterochelin esterase-like enzyme
MRRPPVIRTSVNQTMLVDAKLAELNASLAARPFRGLAFACPFTPNLKRRPNASAQLDAYANWVADVVIPRARKEAPVFADRAHTTLDGNSLGGWIGLEIFSRRPEMFGAWGGIQSAFEPPDLVRYADALAAAFSGPKAPPGTHVHIETSDKDLMQGVNQGLAKLLAERGVAHDYVVLNGDHNALFLRETGTIEMLLWHDRRPR